MNARFKAYWPAILWALFILVICGVKLGGVSKAPMFFAGFDKLTHCGLFFVLAVLYCYGSIRKFKTRGLRIEIAIKNTIVLISYGALIEVLQKYVFTWRSGEPADLFCDALGACMGIFGVLVTSYALNNESI
ncbi:VanZ family protein [Mucilaginibacter psychrotolerans]|uniref:VanZ family protein n=1 Tax=Mucilaginibacter psychrotolerans TaxID=1524096 RepID=A0A4Y8SN99_9SPHI|nr:VanZ family protein [Mucilaginibacter psychrotolerans]TFF40131.1 VanZ family protein [Mucilaginibacter psychrotolerans]